MAVIIIAALKAEMIDDEFKISLWRITVGSKFKLSGDRGGYLLILVAAFAFASKTVLAKMIFQYGVDAVTALALRMAFASSIFGGILAYNLIRKNWRLDLSQRQWFWAFTLGICGYYLSSLLDFSGLVYVSASLGRMILFLYPTLVVLINSFLNRRPVSLTTWLAMATCYSGIVMMMLPDLSSNQPNIWLGSALIFTAAFCYSWYLIGVERMLKSIDPMLFTSLALCFSCLGVLTHFFMTHQPEELLVPLPAMVNAAVMGAFATVLPIYAMAAGIARIGASKTALISMIGPVLTLLMGYFLLDERISFLQLAGMALVIAGVSRVGK